MDPFLFVQIYHMMYTTIYSMTFYRPLHIVASYILLDAV